jgi:hypothetical protein
MLVCLWVSSANRYLDFPQNGSPGHGDTSNTPLELLDNAEQSDGSTAAERSRKLQEKMVGARRGPPNESMIYFKTLRPVVVSLKDKKPRVVTG